MFKATATPVGDQVEFVVEDDRTMVEFIICRDTARKIGLLLTEIADAESVVTDEALYALTDDTPTGEP